MPVIFVCISLVLVPGAILAFSMGFRRITLLGLAPVLSLSLVGVAAVVAPFVGFGWNIWGLIVLCILASAVVWFATNFRQRESKKKSFHHDSWLALGATVIGVASGAFLTGRRIMQLVGAPDNISQRYDNVFQLNAVRHILDTGNGSTLTLGKMAGGQGLGAVYPAVWHDLAALLVQLTGVSIPVAENAVNMTIGAVIWPISIIFLTRVVVGSKPVALIAAGIVSAGLAAFPFLLLVWGPLFPNMLSVAVVPAALAVVIMLCKLADHQERPLRLWLALMLLLPGLAFSHMSGIGALLAFSAPIIAWTVVRFVASLVRAKAPLWKFAVVVVASGAGAVVTLLVWVKLRPGDYSGWRPHQIMGGAVGEVLTNSPMGTRVAWGISILAIVGIFTMVRGRRQIWWLLSYAVAAGLYIIDAAIDPGFIRTFMTGIWYADTNRLAAYLPLFAVVLAALGFNRIVETIVGWWNRGGGAPFELGEMSAAWTKPASVAVVFALLGTLAVVTQLGAIQTYIGANKQFYERNTATSILSDDEYKLLSRIDSEVPADAVIVGNPWNGSSLVYAFEDRPVLRYHLSQRKTLQESIVEQKLNMAASDPVVCKAIRELNVRYVLDFGSQYLLNHPDRLNYEGLQGLASSDAVTLVDQEGAAKLYRVTACW
ncbi:DUF6541 family protein [Arthrobacter psychrochitiniphilus]|uniref:DUF6541 family protein n=1 Tax=Arthrobacter psychrochitiniphilus TaxID=291045 RepID=UPI003F7B3FC5